MRADLGRELDKQNLLVYQAWLGFEIGYTGRGTCPTILHRDKRHDQVCALRLLHGDVKDAGKGGGPLGSGGHNSGEKRPYLAWRRTRGDKCRFLGPPQPQHRGRACVGGWQKGA